MERSGVKPRREIPEARSTEDIDLFLPAEVISDQKSLSMLGDALREQGYVPIETAKFYQFKREIEYHGQQRTLKIDLLAPIPMDDEARAKTIFDKRRIKNRKIKDINAHVAPEALTLDENPLSIEISDGHDTVTIYSPHPYTFLVLKLHAYRDLREKEAKDFGRHHAFDLYRILALITEDEWGEAEKLRDQYQHHQPIQVACKIVKMLFENVYATGKMAIREEARRGGVNLSEEDIQAFTRELQDLFPCLENET